MSGLNLCHCLPCERLWWRDNWFQNTSRTTSIGYSHPMSSLECSHPPRNDAVGYSLGAPVEVWGLGEGSEPGSSSCRDRRRPGCRVSFPRVCLPRQRDAAHAEVPVATPVVRTHSNKPYRCQDQPCWLLNPNRHKHSRCENLCWKRESLTF